MKELFFLNLHHLKYRCCIHMALGLAACSVLTLSGQEQQQGMITGVVKNGATGLFLRDALIEVASLGRSANTDELGRFTITRLPFGAHDLTISYMGLDTRMHSVMLSADNPVARIDVELTTEVYQLERFVVSGEREGMAAALTRQRTADNVKTVVALDAVGYLPNENPSELLIRLPGVTGNLDDEGNIRTVNIRGVDPSLNVVTYDGAEMSTSEGVSNRNFRFLNISASSFEELEVIKASTPDMSASSLGGTVNMKTKTTLNMREDRLFTYRIGMKANPGFFDYTPRRSDHPLGPMVALGYKQVFSIGSGKRNLGMSLDLYHGDNLTNVARTVADYNTNTNNFTNPDYVRQHYTQDGYSVRQQDTATLRFDYQYSQQTRFFISGMYAQSRELIDSGLEYMSTNYNGSGSPKTGYDADYSEWAAGSFQIQQGWNGFMDRQVRAQFGGEHKFSIWEFDYTFTYSDSSVYLDAKSDKSQAGKMLQATIGSVSAFIDRRDSYDFPAFTHIYTTAATNIYNPDNYAQNMLLYHRQGTRNGENYDGKINARASLSLFGLPVQFSTGLAWLEKKLGDVNQQRRWKYNQSTLTHLVDPGVDIDQRFGESITRVPHFNISLVAEDFNQNPQYWTEDAAYYIEQNRSGTRNLQEDIYAAYLMAKTRIGRTSVLAGARFERTEYETHAWVRDKTSDPWNSATWQEQKNSYDDIFPGIHVVYNITKNFQARGSWSTSIGRPSPIDMLPSGTVNETGFVISRGNPDLVPQYGNSFDVSLEYYLKSAGLVSAGVFYKEINDFIYTTSNYIESGEYAGYTENFKSNGGKAKIKGLELSYEQQLAFLPKPLNGLKLALNYTLLRTDGDYGDAGERRSTKEVQNFIPSTANARLSYRYKWLSVSVAANYTDDSLMSYATDPAQLRFKKSRTWIDVNTSVKLSRHMDLFVLLGNVTNEPFIYYRGIANRRQGTIYNGPTVSLGIGGRF